MATTGFWPVKSNLKYTLDYAENPDKTTAESEIYAFFTDYANGNE